MLTSIRTVLLSVLAIAALTAVATLSSRVVLANHLECSNGIDDDGDGRTDFPQDPDCSSSDENAEAANGQPSSVASSAAAASSSVSISSSVPAAAQGVSFQVTVSDGRDTVAPGERLSYTITVQNVSTQPQTSDVILTASRFVLVENVSPQTNVESNIAVWRGVTFDANETKTFTFVGTVDGTTPASSSVNMQVRVGSANAVDATTVQPGAVASSSSASSVVSSVSSASSALSSSPAASSDMTFFSRDVETRTVVPGATVRYTIQVKNTLGAPLTDAVIDERFNPDLLTATSVAGATVVGPGQLRWTLPTVAPGQTWQQTYVMRVAATAGNGVKLTNVASITGRDVGTVSLDDRVLMQTVMVTAASSLPSTGGVMDLLFVLATLPAAAGAAALQRRLRA